MVQRYVTSEPKHLSVSIGYWQDYQLNRTGEIVSVHTVKTCRESRGTTPLILNCVKIWKRVVSYRPRLSLPDMQ